MSNIIVLIASHISHEFRIKTLRQAIDSILNNTQLPNFIYISYSKSINNDLDLPCSSIIKLFYQPTRLYQFEHYCFLSEQINEDDIIMFLDDDDIYHTDKIKQSVEALKKYNSPVHHRHCQFGYLNPLFTNNLEVTNIVKEKEYFDIIMHGKDLKKWFKEEYHLCKENIPGTIDVLFSYSVNSHLFTDQPLIFMRQESAPENFHVWHIEKDNLKPTHTLIGRVNEFGKLEEFIH